MNGVMVGLFLQAAVLLMRLSETVSPINLAKGITPMSFLALVLAPWPVRQKQLTTLCSWRLRTL